MKSPQRKSKGELDELLQAKGRITEMGKGRVWLYIPALVKNDSQFPFQVPEEVMVKIDVENERIVIEKIRK